MTSTPATEGDLQDLETTRRPVGVGMAMNDCESGLVVVCDDGSVWYQRLNGDWKEEKPIPGSPMDKEGPTGSSE